MVLGIQDICHFTSSDIRYYPFYFQGYGILSSIFWLLSGISIFKKINYGDICHFIRDTCLFASRDMGYLVPPPPIQASTMKMGKWVCKTYVFKTLVCKTDSKLLYLTEMQQVVCPVFFLFKQ